MPTGGTASYICVLGATFLTSRAKTLLFTVREESQDRIGRPSARERPAGALAGQRNSGRGYGNSCLHSFAVGGIPTIVRSPRFLIVTQMARSWPSIPLPSTGITGGSRPNAGRPRQETRRRSPTQLQSRSLHKLLEPTPDEVIQALLVLRTALCERNRRLVYTTSCDVTDRLDGKPHDES